MADQEPVTIHLKVGETHTIQLKGKGTTGYEWKADKPDTKAISVKKQLVPLKENAPAGQSAGEQFTIKAMQKGKAEVHLKLSRSWEEGKKPSDEKKYVFVIE